jgi:2-dehydro-3-deoxygluconokinase
MDIRIVTFGEIMLRLNPPNYERFSQARSFDAYYGGGEANVAVSLANFGCQSEFVTRLPQNEIGQACAGRLRQAGVRCDHLVWGGNRIGIYFLEVGVAQRPSKVIYDRENSSFASIMPGMVDWEEVFKGAKWFHWTGITPAVSDSAAQACKEAVLEAHRQKVTISCDLNYRAKLWKWTDSPGRVMGDLVEYCDVVIGNEEDAEKVFGIQALTSDITAGKVEAVRYQEVCEEICRRFPGVRKIAITLRGSLSASHNTWSAVLCDGGNFIVGQEYSILPIVDRVGSGDAFAAGLIYGLNSYPGNSEQALRFAIASSCLKHTIPGDFNQVTVQEVEQLARGDGSGRISR